MNETVKSAIIKLIEGLKTLVRKLRGLQRVQKKTEPVIIPDQVLPPPANHMPMDKLTLFAKAIEKMEAANPALNNPGNLRYTEYTRSLGATRKSDTGFCIFPSYAVGFNALCQMIKDAATDQLKNYHDCTIASFFKLYAPSNDNNNPAAYASFVAAQVGQKVADRLKDFIV